MKAAMKPVPAGPISTVGFTMGAELTRMSWDAAADLAAAMVSATRLASATMNFAPLRSWRRVS